MKLLFAAGLFLLLLIFSSDAEEKYMTNQYVVPPTFISTPVKGWLESDPFAPLRHSEPIKQRLTAKQVFEKAGITFGEEATAIYNPATSTVIVRNTPDQLELVEAYIKSVVTSVEKQIHTTISEVEISDKDAEKLGLDWLIVDDKKLAQNRSQKNVTTFRTYAAMKEEFSRPPSPVKKTNQTAVLGVFTEPQFQVVLKLFEKQKLPVEKLPSLMSRSGQPAMVQTGDRRYGFSNILGADNYTVDINLFLPRPGEALSPGGADFSESCSVTIWDKQTIAVGQRTKNDKNRIVFIKSEVLDPAGLAVWKKEEIEKAREQGQ